MLSVLSVGVVACLVSLLLTPLIRDYFVRRGIVDRPDQERRLHCGEIPRVGGIAVFVSYACSFLVLSLTSWVRPQDLLSSANGLYLAAGLCIVFATGLLDDLIRLRPLLKICGQLIAAFVVWKGGFAIHLIFYNPVADLLSLPLTVLWLLACTNAFNLIDGLDGLSAGAGLFATASVFSVAILEHNPALTLLAVPLAGSLIGFLRYNFNPATVFLGDCGSLTIGFLLGCFGVLLGQKSSTLLGLTAPAMAFSLPLLDTSLAVARRLLRHRPILQGDREHIHHRLLDCGRSPRRTVLLLYGVCAFAALLSLLQRSLDRQFGLAIIAVFFACVWIGIHRLKYREFGVAQRLLTNGTLFHLIDEQVCLEELAKSLTRASSTEEALEKIHSFCAGFGFSDAVLVDGRPAPGHATGTCQIVIHLDGRRSLLLSGLPRKERPLALSQLCSVLFRYFDQESWASETRAVKVLPLQPIARASAGGSLPG